mgnify:CR=1 FL=1|jgi:flagellar biosynthesis GTPase FlhF
MKRLAPELMPKPLRFMDLQLFAEDSKDSGKDSDKGQNEDTGKSQDKDSSKDTSKDSSKDKKTLTQDEVNAIIQARLATEKAKWEEDFKAKLGEAITEAEKLARMNAEQKAEYERQKKETELANREAEITRRELRAQALEALAEKGLPKQLADILVYTDAQSTNDSIVAVEKVFRAAVEAGVNERLKGNPPAGGGTDNKGDKNPWSKEHFNLTEQGRIAKEDPALAARLRAAAGIK